MPSPDRCRSMGAAVRAGDSKKVALLLRAGVRAEDGDGDPFLVTAARFGHAGVFDLLVANGAPLDLPGLLEWAVDGDGGRGSISEHIVERVLSEGQPPADEVAAALRVACATGSRWAVERLVRQGAALDAVDPEFQDSPLLNAVINGHAEIVRYLLGAGADPTLRVRGERKSLYERATDLGHDEIAGLLR